MARRKMPDPVPDADPEDDLDVESADYFLDPTVETFGSGSTVLDCALGGGWPLNRMFNVVGDKSTGKTLIMIEAASQFLMKFGGKARVVYAECEAAFDKAYAAALGMPLSHVRFITDEEPIFTVEQLEVSLTNVMESAALPTLYMVDSYDALSDDKEASMDPGDHATYGTGKAKQGSAMFRRINQKLSRSNMTFGIVSQVRDNIGVTFGRQHKRNGGKCLDFYATHVVWLAKMKNLQCTRQKIKRVHGVQIKAKVDKNKIGMPHREAEFPIRFGYGIENVISCVDWLVTHGKHKKVFDSEKDAAKFLNKLDTLDDKAYSEWEEDLTGAVTEGWREVESLFLPPRKKYANSFDGVIG